MIFGRNIIYSSYTPYSIYFRMAIKIYIYIYTHTVDSGYTIIGLEQSGKGLSHWVVAFCETLF